MTPGTEPCYVWAMDFRRVSVTALADDVRSGRTGARELVTHALERIDALNEAVNAFVAVDDDDGVWRPPPRSTTWWPPDAIRDRWPASPSA